MITLDENDVVKEDENLSFEDDVLNKVNSLKQSLSKGEIPQDLKEFIDSLQNPENVDDDLEKDSELTELDEDAYEVDIDESVPNPDDEDDDLDAPGVSLEELDSMF